MMKMNAGIWIGIIGGIVGLLAGVIAVITTAGSIGLYMGLGMLFLFECIFYLSFRLFFKPMINAAVCRKPGYPEK